MSSKPLPQLSAEPTRFPDCCLSLSTRLLNGITRAILPCVDADSTTTILSIGSGSGLLEALLLRHLLDQQHASITVEGVEVRQSASSAPVNRYLREERTSTVVGTFQLSPRLRDGDVRALMFVYPRKPELVARYVREVVMHCGTAVRVVLWLGPRADWEDFRGCFADAGEVVEEKDGVADYEMMVVLRLLRAATGPEKSASQS